jgi:glucokinase
MGARGVGRGELVVGVDIGGTKTAILVCEPDGTVLARAITPTAVGDPDQAAASIASMVSSALLDANATPDDVAALGIGVPGRVDRERGHVTLAVNLDWHDLPLGSRLEAALGIPTFVENDVRAAALGLYRRRLFGPAESLAFLAVGTGISAGVVLDGVLHRGAHGLAGEIGHVIVEPDGIRCSCGNRGCFETVAAGPALVSRTLAGWAARRNGHPDGAAADAGASAELEADRVREIGAEAVYAAAAAGDPVAANVVDTAGRAIAWGIYLLALACDLERIVIGGGVSHAGDSFMTPVTRELDRYRANSPLAAEILLPDLVQLLPAGADAGAWGAVTIARESLGLGSESLGLGPESPVLAPEGREVGHA